MVGHMNRKYTIAEEIAHRTWFLLKHSQQLNARLGEETLTDLLVLDLLMQPYSSVCVQSVSKPKEAETGADLMIYVRRGADRADKYAVQAKKLYHDNGHNRYGGLNNDAGKSGRKQIDVLEKYAAKCKAVPMYLLYNYIERPVEGYSQYWRCGRKDQDETQFGCTFVPSWHIRDAIDVRGSQNFHWVHLYGTALPWRCAFDCRQGEPWEKIRKKFKENYDTLRSLKSGLDIGMGIIEGIRFESGLSKWPGDLGAESASFSPIPGDIMRDDSQQYYPRWVILVDTYCD